MCTARLVGGTHSGVLYLIAPSYLHPKTKFKFVTPHARHAQRN
jgi:hypothetical protein